MSLIVFAVMLFGGLLQQTPLPTAVVPATEQTATATTDAAATAAPDATAAEDDAADATDADADETGAPFEVLTQQDLKTITGNVQRPNGMVWFGEMLYVLCTGDWTIYRIDAITGSTITFISGTRNAHAMHAETGPDDMVHVWVPDADTSRLMDVVQTRAPSPVASDLNSPWGMAYVDPETFLISSLGSEDLLKVTRSGDVSVVASGFRSPTGVAIDDERIYVANSGSSRRAIEWLDREALDAEAAAEPQPLVRGLQNVSQIVLAPDGKLYFSYAIGTRGVVGRVDPTKCAENGGCDNDQVELVLYTDLSAPLAGLTFSDDMRLFVHTLFRPEIYWAQIEG